MSDELITAIVLSTIMQNGEMIFPGSEVQMTEQEFNHLKRYDAVERVDDQEVVDKKDDDNSNDYLDDELIQQLVAAIGDLSEPDYTSAGKPKIEALEKMLDKKIDADQRDEAWEIYQISQQKADENQA